jgi:hypothetical protein
MCDKLVYDLAQEVEGSPAVFVRKDWVNILDNQNQNYGNNQSVLDTSQLSNSNKYMSYREAYLLVPFTISLAATAQSTVSTGLGGTWPVAAGGPAVAEYFSPATATKSADNSVGLKNWFGQIIHSFTLDYNGTTIIQQTPLVNMWNSFKLMTSLSFQDLETQGATIGFWPDDSDTFQYTQGGTFGGANTGAQGGGSAVLTIAASAAGVGVCNNSTYDAPPVVFGGFAALQSGGGNTGFITRQRWINFDTLGPIGAQTSTSAGVITTSAATLGSLQQASTTCDVLWKSFIKKKLTGTSATSPGIIQYSVTATVYLKHIHSFFNMVPLLKGVFMKMTMNLNNTTTAFQTASAAPVGTGLQYIPYSMSVQSVSNPLGGVNPLMIASGALTLSGTNSATATIASASGGVGLFATGVGSATAITTGAWLNTYSYRLNISVGARCLDTTLVGLGADPTAQSQSVYLYIPAYSFNPVFEQAYLSSPVKEIKYSDIYQYQVLNVIQDGVFNNLVTNGIANIKSVLVLPFYSSSDSTGANTGLGVAGIPVWQSPFDPAGTGPTSPLCPITNFNVQISGQNAIYNMEKYSFEQYNNQLYGYNAVNGGLTDGLTSGLVSRYDFDNCYCYYYVDVSRMLPVEMTVPKSVQIIGQNKSSRAVDLIVFVEYGVSISVDLLTGARV